MAADADGDRFRDECLALFGRVTAGQSHEMANVLSIIKELVGLQEDVLATIEADARMPLAKLRGICEKVQSHIANGQRIVKSVNLFAHSVDERRSVFDVETAIDRIILLARRWASLKKVELSRRLPPQSVSLENSLFFFQAAVFVCIDAALSAAASKRQVSVGYSVVGDGVEIVVTSADPMPLSPAMAAKAALLSRLIDEMGGEMRALSGNEGVDRFSFLVARHARGNAGGTSPAVKED